DTVVDSIAKVVDTIEDKVDTIDTVVDSIATVVDTIEDKVDTIDTVVDSIAIEVDKIRASDFGGTWTILGNHSTENTVLGDLSDILAEIHVEDSPYGFIGDSVEHIYDTVDTIEDKVDTIDTVVDSIATVVDTIEDKIDTVDTVVDSIATVVDTIEDKVDTVDTVVDSIATVVDTIEDKVDTVDTVVDSIAVEVDKIRTTDFGATWTMVQDVLNRVGDWNDSQSDATAADTDTLFGRIGIPTDDASDGDESIFGHVNEILDRIGNVNFNYLNPDADDLTTAINELAADVVTIDTEVDKIRTSDFGGTWTMLQTNFDKIRTSDFGGTWTLATEGFHTTWTAYDDKFVTTWTAYDDKFVETWTAYNDKFVETWTAYNDKFVETWTAYDDKFVTTWTAYDDKFAETWTAYDGKFNETWTQLGVGTTTFIPARTNSLLTGHADLGNTQTSVLGWLKSIYKEVRLVVAQHDAYAVGAVGDMASGYAQGDAVADWNEA
ncbi:hypothetical protein HN446_00730, partial [bacterium]|nr:hypothetical protein [bacterium]